MTNGMPIRDMLEKLSNKESVKQSIANCSVALLGIKVDGKRHKAWPPASGTFVEVAGKRGILTARHVVEDLWSQSPEIGLSIQQKGHHFAIRQDEVDVTEVPKPDKCAKGPDLAFVLLLPQDKLGTIQTQKYFFNLDKRRDQVLSESLPTAVGFWIVSGHPAAYSKSEGPSAHHIHVKAFPNKLCVGGIERQYSEQGFDYIEAAIDHRSGGGVPERLGGLSGGGLWQVPVSQLDGGQTKADEPTLLGVAFWQTAVDQDRSKLICHGRQSIYGVLYDLVARKYSH